MYVCNSSHRKRHSQCYSLLQINHPCIQFIIIETKKSVNRTTSAYFQLCTPNSILLKMLPRWRTYLVHVLNDFANPLPEPPGIIPNGIVLIMCFQSGRSIMPFIISNNIPSPPIEIIPFLHFKTLLFFIKFLKIMKSFLQVKYDIKSFC